MSKTLELRKALLSEIKKTHSNCYYELVPEGATFPYIVFELENVGEQYQVELNVYDKNTSTIQIETLADTLEKYFYRYIYRDDVQVFAMYLNTRNNVQEEDKAIKRRRLLFDLKHFGKDVE